MQKQGVLLGPEYGEFTEIYPQLSFVCTVRTYELIAKVIGYLKHPISTIYRVEFSDGYVSDFDTTNGYWTDAASERTGKASAYAFAIRNELNSIYGFEHHKAYYSFRMKVEGEDKNVYVIVTDNKGIDSYDVRFDGFYQFSLLKYKDEWQYGNTYERDSKDIDSVLVRNISLMLDAHQ